MRERERKKIGEREEEEGLMLVRERRRSLNDQECV